MARTLDAVTFITLILIIFCFKSTAYRNAELTAIPMTVSVGGAITLICHYMGTQDEMAVFWFNGSSSNPLTLTPASDVPECNVFSVVNTTYDLSRIRYTCDSEKNIYTLKFDLVQSVDDNVKWLCTFSDPVPDNNLAEYIVHFGETSGDVDSRGADGGSSSHLSLTGLIVGIISLIVVLAICAGLYFWKKRTYRHNDPRRIKNTTKRMFCHKLPDPDENLMELKLKMMNPERNTD